MPNISAALTATVTQVSSLDLGRNLTQDAPIGFFESATVNGATTLGKPLTIDTAATVDLQAATSLGWGMASEISCSEVDSRPLWEYESDDGNIYAIHLDDDVAEAGALQPAGGAIPLLPDGYVPRHVNGRDASGNYASVVTAADDVLYVDAAITGFVIGTTTYTKTGVTGEKRSG